MPSAATNSSSQKAAAETVTNSTPVAVKPLVPNPFPSAQEAAAHFVRPMFPILDCEGTGQVEPGEVDEHIFQIVAYTDSDRSRKISLAEFIASVHNSNPENEAFIFHEMDADHNGEVTLRELHQHIVRSIEVADLNKDGELTEAEVEMDKFRKPLVTKP